MYMFSLSKQIGMGKIWQNSNNLVKVIHLSTIHLFANYNLAKLYQFTL